MADEQGPTIETPPPPAEDLDGKIVITFSGDRMGIQYTDMKPWKLWGAAKMLEHLGDQLLMQAQAQQMQQQQQAAQILRGLGDLRRQ